MEKKYMTISEAAEYSGLSKWTLYRRSSRREIPMLKYGSKVLIPKEDFKNWLENFRCQLNYKTDKDG
ncbi:MAG: excisionase family DNA-binding protein [Leptospiraceae bacterium]|nr:excisionase family DNA-binding protein [Leptospiraceae bacterium]